jgi:RNA polymerase sporulation-specific sigma factor
MNNRVEICGVNTSKLKLLTEEEKDDLMKRIKAGDKKAYDRFIMGNLRLVLSVTQRFAGRGECMDDLFQVGCIGLIKAVKNFDLSHGVKFSTYAVPMIIGELRRHMRDNSALRVSRSLRHGL